MKGKRNKIENNVMKIIIRIKFRMKIKMNEYDEMNNGENSNDNMK